jgi:hypothetical protein
MDIDVMHPAERLTDDPRASTMSRIGRKGGSMRRGPIAAGLAAMVVLAACATDAGSGTVVTRRIDVASFSALEVSDAFTVHASAGASERLTIRVDDNIVEDLDVGVSGNTLHVGLTPGADVIDATLEGDVPVAAGSLESIQGSGSSAIALDEALTSDAVTLSLSGASRLTGSVQAHDARAELSGASNLMLSGRATSLDVTESGASRLDAAELTVEDLSIDLSGASMADVDVTGSLAAGASGASVLRYAGSPTIERSESSGGSTIQPVG